MFVEVAVLFFSMKIVGKADRLKYLAANHRRRAIANGVAAQVVTGFDIFQLRHLKTLVGRAVFIDKGGAAEGDAHLGAYG